MEEALLHSTGDNCYKNEYLVQELSRSKYFLAQKYLRNYEENLRDSFIMVIESFSTLREEIINNSQNISFFYDLVEENSSYFEDFMLSCYELKDKLNESNLDCDKYLLEVTDLYNFSDNEKKIMESSLQNIQLELHQKNLVDSLLSLQNKIKDHNSEFSQNKSIEELEKFYSEKEKLLKASKNLQDSIVQIIPNIKSFIQPHYLTPDIFNLIDEDELIIVVNSGEIATDGTYISTLSHKGIELEYIDLTSSELANKLIKIKKTVDLTEVESMSEIPKFNYELAYDVYNDIFGHIKNLHDYKDIVLITRGPLNNFPLTTLITQDPSIVDDKKEDYSWMYKDFNISMMPSLRYLLLYRSIPKPFYESNRFLGIGNPVLSQNSSWLKGANSNEKFSDIYQLPSLPGTEIEVNKLSEYFGGTTEDVILLREEANEELFKSFNFSNFGVIAFATHGLGKDSFPDLETSALLLTPPSEINSNIDGLLTVEEIIDLNIRANLIILSICNDDSPEKITENYLSDLSTAFLFSGSRNVLATHWSVESSSAASITTNLAKTFESRPEEGYDFALRKAIDITRQNPKWDHPAFGGSI